MKHSKFLLVNEAAALLQIAPNTVGAWATAGKLREYRHPVNNYRFFRKADVDALQRAIRSPITSAVGSTDKPIRTQPA